MELRRVLGARKRWYARHPRIHLTMLIVCAITLLLGAALRVVSRDDDWVLFSILWGLTGLSVADDAWKVAAQLRRPAAAGLGQADGEADEPNRLTDAIGQVDGTER